MKRWQIALEQRSDDIIKDLLKIRDIGEDLVESFLNPPKLQEYIRNFDRNFIESLRNAKKAILEAADANVPIIIHGDYDADGVCATALMHNVLKKELGYSSVYTFIPNRFEHGYGLSENSVAAVLGMLIKNGYSPDTKFVLITVDSGITAFNETAQLKKAGHTVIITDHHQKPQNLPEADVIVWNDQLVGASIAWVLGLVLGSKNTSNLALASIATVTDLQPLIGFNRRLVLDGLHVISANCPLGIKKLLEVSGRDSKDIDTYALGWVLGPRLNAGGRLNDAAQALELLTTDDSLAAGEIAGMLADVNKERQDMTFEMYDLASLNFDEASMPKIIVSDDERYHEGIIGLVASKLVQKYHRPSIVISTDGDVAKGSVRSVKGINIIEILRNFEDLFLSLGGHPMAAGFSIKTENISLLRQKLAEYTEEHILDSQLVPSLEIDLELMPEEISLSTNSLLQRLKPFGIGNPEPIFLTKNLVVVSINSFGREQAHISLQLATDDIKIKAKMFNGVEHDIMKRLALGDKIDIVFRMSENFYNGSTYLEVVIVDFRYSV
ncbi:single-stranded-DNA-specific exonuclease RecJ [Candidatus Nomurabacteria bacterium]|uniref:Single-stranded-DNA-specific exonuclease RecJ n=1 Tax=candidate division WWE3 bacterium TaxID=2053526 RepID=A0A955E1X6_UNCKA|nr:single-stranded-DNA-specific exonuclease RecJ [candidate division WWE3 bacterium]MCB9824180.1 single-stranded-DNA-specific exonuclease RecJ [Candidatus Nomurabacteria bacterium]MCB9826849.1 single-stranded-DNA-specific exonuclease RecJ [Candidatus Nomurabacteria bacterium]MCB9828121.1 single-stranded-DNA-specific exonuclease RecJ [Candidatus Nomurabacteria bacterium]HXK52435.1 single-stranded-DNA-specific exonuclease RecJ [bacterium]